MNLLSETLKMSTRPHALLSKINDAYFIKYYMHELELFQIELIHLSQGTDNMICKGFIVEQVCCFHSALQSPPKNMVGNIAPQIGLFLLIWYRYLVDEHLRQLFSDVCFQTSACYSHSMKCYLCH